VQKLLEQCYADAKAVLIANRALLDEIAEYLLVKETITGEELMAFVNATDAPADDAPSADAEDFEE
jgi:cell division protease FtsH